MKRKRQRIRKIRFLVMPEWPKWLEVFIVGFLLALCFSTFDRDYYLQGYIQNDRGDYLAENGVIAEFDLVEPRKFSRMLPLDRDVSDYHQHVKEEQEIYAHEIFKNGYDEHQLFDFEKAIPLELALRLVFDKEHESK